MASVQTDKATRRKGGCVMGRIRSEIDVNGRQYWTLFDSGARNSYIVRRATRALDRTKLPVPRKTSFGGRTHQVKEICLVLATVEGHRVEFQANVVSEIGVDEDGRSIDVLFGALAMQLWNIKLDLKNECLDFSHFTPDFV